MPGETSYTGRSRDQLMLRCSAPESSVRMVVLKAGPPCATAEMLGGNWTSSNDAGTSPVPLLRARQFVAHDRRDLRQRPTEAVDRSRCRVPGVDVDVHSVAALALTIGLRP